MRDAQQLIYSSRLGRLQMVMMCQRTLVVRIELPRILVGREERHIGGNVIMSAVLFHFISAIPPLKRQLISVGRHQSEPTVALALLLLIATASAVVISHLPKVSLWLGDHTYTRVLGSVDGALSDHFTHPTTKRFGCGREKWPSCRSYTPCLAVLLRVILIFTCISGTSGPDTFGGLAYLPPLSREAKCYAGGLINQLRLCRQPR